MNIKQIIKYILISWTFIIALGVCQGQYCCAANNNATLTKKLQQTNNKRNLMLQKKQQADLKDLPNNM